jgi:hypothetical protein
MVNEPEGDSIPLEVFQFWAEIVLRSPESEDIGATLHTNEASYGRKMLSVLRL